MDSVPVSAAGCVCTFVAGSHTRKISKTLIIGMKYPVLIQNYARNFCCRFLFSDTYRDGFLKSRTAVELIFYLICHDLILEECGYEQQVFRFHIFNVSGVNRITASIEYQRFLPV